MSASMFMAIAGHHGALGNAGGVVAGQYALVSDGNQYIDTGELLGNNTDYTITCAVVDTGDNMRMGFETTTLANFVAYFGLLGYQKRWGNTALVGVTDTYFHTIEKSGTDYLFDAQSPQSVGTIGTTSETGLLFAYDTDGGGIKANRGKVSSFRLLQSSVLTLNMWAVPAGMTAQGASSAAPSNCMWDAVSETYFENQGTGTFTVEDISGGDPDNVVDGANNVVDGVNNVVNT